VSALLGAFILLTSALGCISLARGLGRTALACGRAIARPFALLGDWIKRCVVVYRRVTDHKQNGLVRLQAEVNAQLVGELAAMRQEMVELRTASKVPASAKPQPQWVIDAMSHEVPPS
jgi:hypothetical protein